MAIDNVRLSTEWDAVAAALGPHAHPGLSPSECVAEVVAQLRQAEVLGDQAEQELEQAEAERDALRAEVTEARRAQYQVLWKALKDAGITRGDGCPDSILIEEVTKLRAEVERVKMLLGKAAQEIHCAGPVDHRIRVLRREHADLVLRLAARAERAEAALREIEQATEGIPEQNCMLANRIARLALLATAPAEGFFARGDDGQYRTDPAPACPHGNPPGSARDCACHEEKP